MCRLSLLSVIQSRRHLFLERLQSAELLEQASRNNRSGRKNLCIEKWSIETNRVTNEDCSTECQLHDES